MGYIRACGRAGNSMADNMKVTFTPTCNVDVADVSEPNKYVSVAAANLKLETAVNGFNVAAELPHTAITGERNGCKLVATKDGLKVTYDVAAKPADAVKVEYKQSVEVGSRDVDVKGTFKSKNQEAIIEASTMLDNSTKMTANYNFRSKVTPGKLSYTYDLTTLDLSHEFNSSNTQLDISRKLQGGDKVTEKKKQKKTKGKTAKNKKKPKCKEKERP